MQFCNCDQPAINPSPVRNPEVTHTVPVKHPLQTHRRLRISTVVFFLNDLQWAFKVTALMDGELALVAPVVLDKLGHSDGQITNIALETLQGLELVTLPPKL